MRVALLCSGLGNVKRGHEVFVKDLFEILKDEVDITLYKGGGKKSSKQIVVSNIPRESESVSGLKQNLVCSEKWRNAIDEEKRTELEMTTFAYNVLPMLLNEGYDIIHCPDAIVIDTLYRYRDFFKKRPKFVYANGGAIGPESYPHFDFIQHHSLYSYSISGKYKKKGFIIPYSVDTSKFKPGNNCEVRRKFNIPDDAFLILSVGTIADNHKRMSHLIKEASRVKKPVHVLILGHENNETPKIKALGKRLLGDKVHFGSMEHKDLWKAYQAADLFVLCSLFEGFGIVFLEAMASGLPIIATNHPNQKWIMRDAAVLIDMKKTGRLSHQIGLMAGCKDLNQKGIVRSKSFSETVIRTIYIKRLNKLLMKKLKFKKYNRVDNFAVGLIRKLTGKGH